MRFRRIRGPGAADTGSATLEAVIIAPVFILLITVAVVLGRIATFHSAVQEAAQAAARAGSLARNANDAKNAADATWAGLVTDGASSASPNNIHCTAPQSLPSPQGFSNPPGTWNAIAVNATTVPDTAKTMFGITAICTLKTDWMLGLFSTDITVKQTAYSPIDPFRSHGAP